MFDEAHRSWNEFFSYLIASFSCDEGVNWFIEHIYHTSA